MSVVLLADFRPAPPEPATKEGQARCLACRHEWVAVAPLEVIVLECPACSLNQGRFINPVHRHVLAHWECKCGNDLFHVTPDGYYCPACGVWATGF